MEPFEEWLHPVAEGDVLDSSYRMNLNAELEAVRLAARAAAADQPEVRVRTDFAALVRDELADVEVARHVDRSSPSPKVLGELYELRARMLDWELGTGYLGFFSPNAGTRYVFNRRLGVLWRLMEDVPPGRALEVGCGAGIASLLLDRRGHEVTGVDIAPTAVAFARCAAAHLPGARAHFEVASAEALPYDDSSFDLVLAGEVLEHLTDPAAALREWRRVLRSDGVLLLSCPCAETPSEWFANVARRVMPGLEAEREDGFDKKTFVEARRRGVDLPDEAFVLTHLRFGFNHLEKLFARTGFDIRAHAGAIFAFPPHYGVVYRLMPGFVLPLVTAMEWVLQRFGLFSRLASVTTCFRLRPEAPAA